jgi:DNA-binding MarR family transcriptional regulator
MGERKMTDKKFPFLLKRQEIQIIYLFYFSSNMYDSYTTTEVSKAIGSTPLTTLRYLRKLEKMGILKSIQTRPIFWESVRDEKLRNEIKNHLRSLIKTLFPKKEKILKEKI